MERYKVFYICFIINMSLAVFPTLVRVALTAETEALSVISNSTRTCTCPGDSVTFTCTAIGGEATLWSGPAFPSNCSITLNHSRFSESGGTSDLCSNQGIVGRSIKRTNNCYTSQLTVPGNSESINRTVECAVIHNSTSTSLIGTEVVMTTESFPPPDDFRLQPTVFLQRLQFTWTDKETYRNCSSLTYVYLTNCTCRISRGIIGGILCSNLSTVALTCLFQLQISICNNIIGNASDPVYVTLKVPEAPVIISAVISVSFLDINFTQAEEFPISDRVNATIDSYNVTFMQTSTGNICGSSRRYVVFCQKGFCIESVLIPSFCEGSAISIVISAINNLGSGPNSKPFNVQGIPGTYFDSGLRLSALQKLIGGVIGGAGAFIAALISITGTILKMKGTLCCKGETVCELEETSTTTTITLQWKPRTKISKGVTAYRVEYSENKPSSLKKSVDISIEETSFTVTELLPGTEYQVNVRTVTANGTGTPAEIIATTKDQQHELSIQIIFSIKNKTGALASVLNKIITQGFKICEIQSCQPIKEIESQFHVNADCICLNTEDKKREMEKILKTQSCARGIVIKVLEESKTEAEHEMSERRLPYCIIFKSTVLHQAMLEIVGQFSELNITIDHIESFDSPDSSRVYSIHVKCDCKDEDTKTELKAKLKACTGTLNDIEFLPLSEAYEAPDQIIKTPYECTLRISFLLCDGNTSKPLISILQILQRQGLSIVYVDSFEIMSSAKQYVVLECVQQVQVDRERRVMVEELELIQKDTSIEEVFCTELSSETIHNQSRNNQHFWLELTLEDLEGKMFVLLKMLTDQGVCINNISSTMQQSEQNLQKCTLKCTTESLLLIRKELIKRFQNTFNSEVNLQEIPSQGGDECLAQSNNGPLSPSCHPACQIPQVV